MNGNIVERLAIYGKETLIIASVSDQKRILADFFSAGAIHEFKLKNPNVFLDRFLDDYLLWMKNEFGVDFNYAERIKETLCMIDFTEAASSQVAFVAKIKKRLVETGSIQAIVPDLHSYERIVLINLEHVPGLPSDLSYESLYLDLPSTEQVIEYEALTSIEVADAVYNVVISLLDKGVSPEKIKIGNATRRDEYQLSKLFRIGNIPFNCRISRCLYDHPLTQTFLSDSERFSVENAWNNLKESIVTDSPLEQEVLQAILSVLNKYTISVLDDNMELLRHEFRKSSYTEPKMSESIDIYGSEFSERQKDEHWLIINATSERLPAVAIDNDVLSDQEKASLSLPTSSLLNARQKAKIEKTLSRIVNLTLFRQIYDNDLPTLPLELELGRDRIVRPSSDLKWHVSVSREYDRFIHAKLAYENKTYGKMSMRFHNLQALIGNDNEVYDPQFSGLSIASIDGLLGRKVTISPTSLGRFYQCPFSFLLGSILKIKPDQKTFTTYFGNLAHMVIESVYTEDDANYVEYLEACSNDMPEDHVYKQDILKKIVVDKLEAVRKAMIEFRKQGNFRVIGSEWSHEFDFWDDVRFRIKGKIDRIIAIKKNEDELIIVIDYKTGSQKFSKADFDEGINVQLPFYLYLFKKRHPEALYVPAGFFIQRLPLGRLDVEDDDTMTLSLKLNGWMLEDKHLFNSLGGSDWLEGIQLNNDEGFRKSERLLDRDTMTDLINKVDELISAAIHEIAAGKFPIKPMPPKPNQRISNSCKYCRFDSVCYLKSLGVALDRLEGSGDDEQI